MGQKSAEINFFCGLVLLQYLLGFVKFVVVSMCQIVLNCIRLISHAPTCAIGILSFSIYLVFLAASSPKSRAVAGAGGVSCNARNVSGNWRFDWIQEED